MPFPPTTRAYYYFNPAEASGGVGAQESSDAQHEMSEWEMWQRLNKGGVDVRYVRVRVRVRVCVCVCVLSPTVFRENTYANMLSETQTKWRKKIVLRRRWRYAHQSHEVTVLFVLFFPHDFILNDGPLEPSRTKEQRAFSSVDLFRIGQGVKVAP